MVRINLAIIRFPFYGASPQSDRHFRPANLPALPPQGGLKHTFISCCVVAAVSLAVVVVEGGQRSGVVVVVATLHRFCLGSTKSVLCYNPHTAP